MRFSNKFSVVFSFVLSLAPWVGFAQVSNIAISDNWLFTQTGNNHWQPAVIPGTVQEDLLRLGLIPNPFFRNNEDSIQWIENQNWTYKTNFSVPAEILKKKYHNLNFDGLDTYADVFLNGKKILATNNMHRHWTVEVSKMLKAENSLEINFMSPIKQGKEILEALPYKLPTGNDAGEEKVSPVVRKAAFQFGWDWAPRVVTCGIWRPIYLVSYDENRISNISIQNENNKGKAAILNLEIDIAHYAGPVEISVIVDGNVHVRQNAEKKTGSTTKIPVIFRNPELWQPHNIGKQRLYNIRVELRKEDQLADFREISYGIRTCNLIMEPDNVGTSFYFVINSNAEFIKGANYVPQSPFINAKTKADYLKLLLSARDANINLLRVWGGGIYENDVFYDLCDSLGIMVWQDFMFANTMYPADSAFLANIAAEVAENVERLKYHPCIIHWNGNNEIDVAWKNWGWQHECEYSPADSTLLDENYKEIFQEIIPQTLRTIIPEANYTHTSPLSNWGNPDNFRHGSMHYWGVYHGTDSFADYAHNVGRFNAEFGFQSFPDFSTATTFFPDSQNIAFRQKSYKGNEPIISFVEQYLPAPRNLEELCFFSQLTQAIGVGYAIQNHRINQPRCMGSMYWQLNDCWPAISWSSIDYSGTWKALHYAIKKAFANEALFIDTLAGKLSLVYVCDRSSGKKSRNCLVTVLDASGDRVMDTIVRVHPLPKVQQIDLSHLLSIMGDYHFICAELDEIRTIHSFQPPKKMFLKPAHIKSKILEADSLIEITLQSENLAKNIWLESLIPGSFSDNYFDLLPGKPLKIIFTPEKTGENFQSGLKIRCLNDYLTN
ncbi:MAG: hypothetical protein KKA07_09475 [Bacteroidetes bacterium]|nr:hypothetical protein [Bacteroidota bacterium]MBU1719291.1 hypothetical protein [Bacteroidota bacterium]